MTASPVLRIEDLSLDFVNRDGNLKALREISFDIARGEVLGLVGESGSGKSLTGFSIMGLTDRAARITGGRVLFQGEDLLSAAPARLRQIRGDRIAMIFQDPMMTLNPVLRIGSQMTEVVHAHRKMSREAARRLCADTLGMMGIPSPDERLDAYPHEFSGGMRQRVSIAIALLLKPDLIIADEPTTALDVTVQAQILAEVSNLVQRLGTAMLWISHDISVVASITQKIAVMYAGRIVEHGPAGAVLDHPSHPYTRALLSTLPSANAPGRPITQIRGSALSLREVDGGCSFRNRCPHALPLCAAPQPSVTVGPEHLSRCCRIESLRHD